MVAKLDDGRANLRSGLRVSEEYSGAHYSGAAEQNSGAVEQHSGARYSGATGQRVGRRPKLSSYESAEQTESSSRTQSKSQPAEAVGQRRAKFDWKTSQPETVTTAVAKPRKCSIDSAAVPASDSEEREGGSEEEVAARSRTRSVERRPCSAHVGKHVSHKSDKTVETVKTSAGRPDRSPSSPDSSDADDRKKRRIGVATSANLMRRNSFKRRTESVMSHRIKMASWRQR